MRNLLRSFVVFYGLMLCVSLSAANDDLCSDLAGEWHGQGDVKWFFFTCQYNSVAHVYGDEPAQADVTFTKTSGIFLCPSEGAHSVTIDCYNNRVEMKDDKIDAAGRLSQNGERVDFIGNLYVFFRYHPFKLIVNKV